MKLDKFDLKLLYELDNNSRQSYNQLAKKLRNNKNTVRYRIEQLKKSEIIKKFLTIIDVSPLDLSHQKVFLRLHNLNPTKKQELIKYTLNNKNIVWAASSDGSYDFIFSIRAKNLKDFKNIFMDFLNKFDNIIKERTVTSLLEGEYLPRDYLIEKKRIPLKKITVGVKKEKLKIDKIDQKILSSLAQDSRIPTIDIANNLKLTAVSIASRIKKLEKIDIIQKYSILLSNKKLGQLHYKILIGLHNITQGKEKLLIDYLKQQKNIVFMVNALGLWEIEIDLEVKNTIEFRDIIMKITNKFSDIIKDYSVLQVYDIHKYNLFP